MKAMRYSTSAGIRAILIGVLLVGSATTAVADEPMFVAGYDRFFSFQNEPSATAGKLLLTELSCTACHEPTAKTLAPKRGPRLSAAGLRLQTDWLQRYLQNPSELKPGSTMPDVLHALDGKKKLDTIAALVAFLSTQDEPFPTLVSTALNPIAVKFWKKGDQQRGRILYHQVGCVACHEPAADQPGSAQQTQLEKLLAQLEPDEIEALGLSDAARPVRSVPHGKLAEKYSHESLSHFLIDPVLVRPHGRMPSLKLNPAEAADIASFVLREKEPTTESAEASHPSRDAELIARGARLFRELNCAACHDVKQDALKPQSPQEPGVAKPLARLAENSPDGCLAKAASSQPRFSLSDHQARSLRAAIAESNRVPKIETTQPNGQPILSTLASDAVQFALLQLNCFACHERGKQGGVGLGRRQHFETDNDIDLGDEGRLPPPLDGLGYKLKPTWLKIVFEGKGDLRPYLLTRMPLFPGHATQSLPTLFVTADRQQKKPTPEFENAVKLAEAGRELLDTGCVQCHAVRGERLPGVIGIDVSGIEQRINPDWFREFLLNPAKLKERTRMPTFFPNARSSNQTVLAGNVDQQIAAMWGYMNEPGKLPLPEKILAGKIHNFELKPVDHPIVLRTFMKAAGPHAIAVGFPQGVHIAFDAEVVRFAQAWRGRFLDAHGTWFDRFTPAAEPLGDDVITIPASHPLAILNDAASSWPTGQAAEKSYRFRGYRLDNTGTPTFRYEFASIQVSDRIVPVGKSSLERTITFDGVKSETETEMWLLANSGSRLTAAGETGQTNSQSLTVRVSTTLAAQGMVRTSGQRHEWIIPIQVKNGTTIKLTYDW